ncbi:hypothetical protein M0804_013432 [Polistes exclamans]|nr:hypothetical protein M0804_013432 [Polistes exclamans]
MRQGLFYRSYQVRIYLVTSLHSITLHDIALCGLCKPRPGRRSRGRPGNNTTQLQTTPRVQSPISQHLEKGIELVGYVCVKVEKCMDEWYKMGMLFLGGNRVEVSDGINDVRIDLRKANCVLE